MIREKSDNHYVFSRNIFLCAMRETWLIDGDSLKYALYSMVRIDIVNIHVQKTVGEFIAQR